jgi:hypothetical protein
MHDDQTRLYRRLLSKLSMSTPMKSRNDAHTVLGLQGRDDGAAKVQEKGIRHLLRRWRQIRKSRKLARNQRELPKRPSRLAAEWPVSSWLLVNG